MARIKTKQVHGVGRITLEYAIDQFMRHNRLKNLSPRTIEYYTEDLRYFQKITEVTWARRRFSPVLLSEKTRKIR